jgi:hypothetical protein
VLFFVEAVQHSRVNLLLRYTAEHALDNGDLVPRCLLKIKLKVVRTARVADNLANPGGGLIAHMK